MKFFFQSAAACALLLGVAGIAVARMYQVEILAFAYTGGAAEEGAGRLEVVWERPGVAVAAVVADEDGAAAEEDALQGEIQMYPGSILRPHVNELAQKDSYRVLRYMSWVQPAAEKEKVDAVDLSTPGLADIDREPELSGAAHVYVIQPYLQAELDLRYLSGGEGGQNQVRSVHSAYGLSLQKHRAHRMRQQRRIKLNEINYYDHPRFGVLMVVSRFAAPAPAEAPATAPESTAPAARTPAGG
ncbi:MAG: CsiV family protein [Gammaproteobacteria bacterium]|nr:CsiV family protein [Gammaproteobacteria bacterium]MDD9850448.1 CsiV family protein [Gammaproteobacteria bacterium]